MPITDLTPADYDILVWRESDGWHWLVMHVKNGRDAGTLVRGGPEISEIKALGAAECAPKKKSADV